MGYRFSILGCGPSGGVPRIGDDWGACDPAEPRNSRRRSCFVVERFASDVSRDGAAETVTRLLVDTSPDLRAQLLDAKIAVLDGVVFTHGHADHIHGIDELRVVCFNGQKRVPVYYDDKTGAELLSKFGYCFEQPEDSNYVPILEGHELEPEMPLQIEGAGGVIDCLPFRQIHGGGQSLGLKFGSLVYATDVSEFPESSLKYLEGLDVLVLGALRDTPHPCHFSVEQALEVIERYQPKRAILTHMHNNLDYQTLKNELPPHVEPAYDGLVIEVEG